MNALIERVAEALYAYDGANSTYRWSSWSFAAVAKQQKYRERANVCIEAMRKPTEVMLKTAQKDGKCGGYGYADECYPADPLEVWQAMIDEALK